MLSFFRYFAISGALIGFMYGLNLSAQVSTADLAKSAETQYANRDYTPEGIANVQKAYENLKTILAGNLSDEEKMKFNLKLARALYFIGDASNDTSVKRKIFEEAMAAADASLLFFGVTINGKNDLTDELAKSLNEKFGTDKSKMDALAEAFYQKGANLGQWGQLDPLGAIYRWGELQNTIQFQDKLNFTSTSADGSTKEESYKSLHEYAGYRVVGRGLYVIPSKILGGDNKKSEKYLEFAVKNSAAVDANGKKLSFSINGHNNNYYAETLRANGKEELAKQILTDFIAADPKDTQIFPNQVDLVEIIRTQKIARDTLSKM